MPRNGLLASLQQNFQHLLEALAIRWIEQAGAVEAGLAEHGLHMRERAKARFAMIATHARWTDSAEGQLMLGYVIERVVEADAAGVGACQHVIDFRLILFEQV